MLENNAHSLATTGIPSLDDILGGGLTRRRVYLVEGNPGTGKTTLALQFLLEGVARGERCLYVSMSESAEELKASAKSHGWSLDGIEIFELITSAELLSSDQHQSLLYSSDLELGEATQAIFNQAKRLNPLRVVIDSLSEFQLLAQGSIRYRRQLLAIKHFFSSRDSTVIMLDDMTADGKDRTIHSIVHGVVHLDELAPLYGAERRRLRVIKYRGRRFRGGYHDFSIETGGVIVYPRLVAAEHHRTFLAGLAGSGNPRLDELLGGGLERGSNMLLIGPSGAGKSLVALQFVKAALERGEKAAVYVFDEEIGLLKRRALGMGFDLDKPVNDGKLLLEPVDAAELSPGEFAHMVRRHVAEQDVSTVVIDSLNGYQAAMPEEQFLILHLHELLTYLNRQGVCTIVPLAQHGLFGDMKSPVDVTYLSDTILLLRFFESQGRVLRAISAVKKRTGKHEDTIREFTIGTDGVVIGKALSNFQGVLRGAPQYLGETNELLGTKT